MKKKLLLAAVNYNTSDETIQFIESLSKLEAIQDIEILIIENSKPELRNPLLKEKLVLLKKDILFIETTSNKNYFGSVNFALQSLSLNAESFDYFVISNVDILIKDKSFFTKLFAFEDPKVGIIAPSVFSMAQEFDQNPYKTNRFRKSYFYYYRLVYHHLIFTRIHEAMAAVLRKRIKNISVRSAAGSYIYAPHGAFIIFLKKYFTSGCSIDYGDLLFCEEIFVADECRRNNLSVWYEPTLQVLHAEHVSMNTLSGELVRKLKLKTIKYFLKHF